MSATLLEKAPAKINLTLRVLGRRSDGYHELESLVAFADVSDLLHLQPRAEDDLEIVGPFAAQSGPLSDNLVLKALRELRSRVDGLKAGRFVLEKNLPVAAGLGGGSADAAAALRLLGGLNNIALSDCRLMASAQSVGADVPVCVDSRPRIMRGVGERLSDPLELPALIPAILVNPGIPVSTRDVFINFCAQERDGALSDIPDSFDALIECLHRHGNDLTDAAIAYAPAVGEVLDVLKRLPGNRLARMSGSGATCFALFPSAEQASVAAKQIVSAREDWWVRATTIGCGRS